MTKKQALIQARKVLGKKAHVEERKPTKHRARCAIGRILSVIGIPMFMVYAEGDNWQATVDRLEEKARSGEQFI